MNEAVVDLDLAALLVIEQTVNQAEGNGIEARWRFGHAILEMIPPGTKKLPKGRRTEIAQAIRKGEAEVDRRLALARRCPTRAELDHVMIQFPSWYQVVNEFLSSTAHLSAEKDEWETPQDLFDELDAEFHFTLDVCASEANAKCTTFYSVEDEALSQPWQGICWMNPPYSGIEAWMEKALAESQAGATVVCLVPSRTDVAWFWDFARQGEIRLLRGRLHFTDDEGNTGPAPFPSVVVVFGREPGVAWYERP